MRNIEKAFAAAAPLSASLPPMVASGACFHASPDYYAMDEHYGYALLDQSGGSTFLSTNFAFFFPTNPYASLSLAEARALNPAALNPERAIEFKPAFAYQDRNSGDASFPWRYFLKASGDEILLLADWGPDHQIFCRLKKNS